MNSKLFLIYILSVLLVAHHNCALAQEWSSPEVEQMYQQGMLSLSKANATEATAIFQKIKIIEPNNFLVKKSLAQSYQLSGYQKMALNELEPLFANNTADAECYRIAALANMGIQEDKKALKVLTDGIAKHPQSGLLYYERGIIYKQQKNYENALKSWLDGIAADPNYHLNYHEAAIAYVQTEQVIWAIIYGEIFVNKEPNTKRSNDMRILILDAYQKLFFTPSKNPNDNVINEPKNFEEAVKKNYLSLFFVVSDGINTENLTMLRSRFMVNWQNNYATRFPFGLFDYWDDMMRNGHFDAYSQWIFGKVENPQLYDNWMSTFGDDMSNFLEYRAKKQPNITAKDNYNNNRNFKGFFETKKDKAAKR